MPPPPRPNTKFDDVFKVPHAVKPSKNKVHVWKKINTILSRVSFGTCVECVGLERNPVMFGRRFFSCQSHDLYRCSVVLLAGLEGGTPERTSREIRTFHF